MFRKLKFKANEFNKSIFFGGKSSRLIQTTSLILIVTVLVIGFLLAQPTSEKKKGVGRIYQSAGQFYYFGEYEKSIELLKKGLKIDNNDPLLLSSMILSISSLGNQTGTEAKAFDAASGYVKKALKDEGSNKDVLMAVGYSYETAGKWEDALGYYEKAIGRDNRSSLAWFHKGHALEFLGRPEEAKKAYDKAFELDSKDPSILLVKAKQEATSGKNERAKKIYEEIAGMENIQSSIKAEALTGASILARNDVLDLKKALDFSKKAVNTDKRYSPGLAVHGVNLSLTGDLKKGTAFIFQAIKTNPRIANNYLQMAIVLRAGGYKKEAIDYLKGGLSKIDDDNTILGQEDRRRIKALLTYELAKTYWENKSERELVLVTLEDAYGIDPKISSKLEFDLKKARSFSDLTGDPRFLAVLQSR